jgi:hypothetical protein
MWAGDGGDVVSVNVGPVDPEALKALMDDIRDVQPQEMPSVQVPAGEYGNSAEDIRPDGPPGSIDPGPPERSA